MLPVAEQAIISLGEGWTPLIRTKRLGARLDGVLRAHTPAADGGIRDTATYSLLASEWPKARERLTAKLRAPREAAG